MKRKDVTLGWHFLQRNKKLGYADGRPVHKKRWFKAKNCRTTRLCSCGMHASENILDALKWAPGPVLCQVKVHGNIKVASNNDKFVGMERLVIDWINAEDVIQEFSVWCFERGLKTCNITNKVCWKILKEHKQRLAGKVGSDLSSIYNNLPFKETNNLSRSHIRTVVASLCEYQHNKIEFCKNITNNVALAISNRDPKVLPDRRNSIFLHELLIMERKLRSIVIKEFQKQK